MIRVLVWAENKPLPEHREQMKRIYPSGIECAIADFLKEDKEICVHTATMQEEEHRSAP